MHHSLSESSQPSIRELNLSNGNLLVKENNQWILLNQYKQRISKDFFEELGEITGNLIPVKQNGKWGYLDRNGKIIIACTYDHLSKFLGRAAIVRKMDRWVLIDSSGKHEKVLDIENYIGIDQHQFIVYKHGQKARMDQNGNLVAPGWISDPSATIIASSSTPLSVNNAACPPNVNFEEGLFDQWECFIGSVRAVGNQNVVTMNPTTPVPADPNRHLIIPRTIPSALDFYGNFPVNPPDGSNFAVKLGNTQVGAQAERIRYRIDVPASAQQFFVVFQYAVVYEEPQNEPHRPEEHPRFTARLFDPQSNSVDICANFDFNSSDPTGFQVSPIRSQRGDPVLYKPWQSVFINLTKYAGRTVYLEFTTADCTKTGHWGYAYVDVDDCDLNIKATNSCINNSTVLRGPTGFSNVKWWNSNFTVKYGEGVNLTINPSLPANTQIKLELTPFSGQACKDTANVTIVSPQVRIELGNDKSICAGDSVIIGGNPQPNATYQWTSSSTLSSTAISNPKAFPTVTTKYYLSATDNETGCKAQDSITVNVKPKPVITVNSPSVCPGQTAQLNATGATTYTWSPATSLNNTTGATVTSSPNNTIVYTVTGTETTTGCRNSTTATVSILPKPNVSVNSETVCSGIPAVLNATGAATYTWTPSSFLNSANGASVNATPPDTLTYEVIGTNAAGCKDTASAVVNVLPLPNIRLNNATICFGREAKLTAVGGINYVWGTGSNITTLAPDTIQVRPTVTSVYSVTGTDSTNGCKRTIQSTVTVNPLPVLTVNSPSICRGNSATITVGGADRYNWTADPSLNSLTGATVTANPLTTTVYNVTGTNNATGCVNSISSTVTVNPLPTGTIIINGNNQYICEGYGVQLTGSGGNTYQWYLNNNAIAGATASTYQATQAGTYSLELTSSFGCKNFVSATPSFQVLRKPSPGFRAPSGCVGNTISFTNLSQSGLSGPVTYNWSFGDGNSSSLENPTHIYTKGSSYQVKLKVIPTICPILTDSTTQLIFIDAPRPGIRYPTVNALVNNYNSLNARTFGSIYSWQPRVGLSNYNTANPLFNFDQETDYTVNITTASGCVTVDSVLVRLFSNADIQVPKAFTPNGDGHNDRLDVFLIGIKDLLFFRVFNRWGQLMFETKDPRQLWDGTFQGKNQPLETYVWIAQGRAFNGQIITKRGQTILIR